MVDGQPVPDRNEEYLLHQTLVGAWPAGRMDEAACAAFRSRIREYMIKSAREAKVNSSWINPNVPYEEALAAFIDAILADDPGNEFLKAFMPFQEQIARCGAFTSLSQTLLKIASPGVPDFYQGTELWDLTLVDPDNRRPVDYRSRSDALAALKKREAEIGPRELTRELLAEWEDGRIKLYLTYKGLNYRREHRELFEKGTYLPLEAGGGRGRHVCAFARRVGERCVIAAAPRFMADLIPEPGMVPCGEKVWGDSFLTMPEGGGTTYRNILTGGTVTAIGHEGETVLPLAEVFADSPVAFLETDGD